MLGPPQDLVWQNVVAATELAERGAWLRTELAGASIIVVNDGEQVRAFHNVCQHRGHPLKDTANGRCDHFVCPLHGWAYQLDGALQRIPQRAAFSHVDTAKLALSSLLCRVVDGRIEVARANAVAANGRSDDHATR